MDPVLEVEVWSLDRMAQRQYLAPQHHTQTLLARGSHLLSDLAEEQEPVAAPLTATLGDDGLSLLLRDFLGDDASLACASAFFRHVLRPRVLGLSGAPSMSLVESIAAAAA